jgi:EAL domain-containing protein (putative c-di-GMP-specific phosphodiesterase class I)/GGDEF domain-containing protein
MTEVGGILAQARACTHALQPIVCTTRLRLFGAEALARLPGESDGAGVLDLLDRADRAGAIMDVERVLVEGAMRRFAASGLARNASLFCNVDNRIFTGDVPEFQVLERSIIAAGLTLDRVVWEISERDPIPLEGAVSEFLSRVARSEVRIALDDFGIGISNLERLLVIEPHYVKIDRCFIDGMANNRRKTAIVAKLCGLAHALGYSTVAEGVETERDFRAARDAVCDFAQGFLIARPTLDAGSIRQSYDSVVQPALRNPSISEHVAELVEMVPPVHIDTLLVDAAERFNQDQNLALVPVVDHLGVFKGAIYERDIRQLLLSDFGRELLSNRGAPPRVESRAKRCPVVDVHATIDNIVNSYVAAEAASGLVLLDSGIYAGYLSNNAVLRLAAEREILQARDQNPLTRLPGNRAIESFIARSLAEREPLTLAVIDFDNFKAFNDRYGFAAGDRALQMFGDALRRLSRQHPTEAFIGHIGGDDFFVGLSNEGDAGFRAIVELCDKFASDAASLYSPLDREAGGINGRDRFGTSRFFPLLRASAGILRLPDERASLSRATLDNRLAALKAEAKTAAEGVAVGGLDCANVVTQSIFELEARLAG